MRYLCDAFAVTDAGWEARVRIPAGSEFFRGHFEGDPILPGVALLAIAHELLTTRIPKLPALLGLRGLRFRNPVRPGSLLVCEFKRGAAGALVLDATSDAAPIAEGTLLFAGDLPHG